MKVVVEERESAALRDLLARRPEQVGSVLVEVEILRTVRRYAPSLEAAAHRALEQLTMVELDDGIRSRASLLGPLTLRSLDAIHLATALGLGEELDAVVTYDARLGAAAESSGLTVLSPS